MKKRATRFRFRVRPLFTDQRGFSLVELIIVLTLLGIVLGVAYTFYHFGTTSFAAGEQRMDVQQNTRLAADFISREIRFAENMEIIPDHENLEIDFYYIFVEDGAIKHKPRGEETVYSILENISGNIDFTLSFSVSDDSSNTLIFNLRADDGNKNFNLDTEVLLVNLQTITGSSGYVIRYQVPAPPGPLLKSIELSPEGHVLYDGTDQVTVTVRTNYIENDTAMATAYIYHSDLTYEEEDYTAVSAKVPIVNNLAQLVLKFDKDVEPEAGVYHVVVVIDMKISADEYRETYFQGKNYVIELPVIESIRATTVQRGNKDHPTQIEVTVTTNAALVGKSANIQILENSTIRAQETVLVQEDGVGGGLAREILSSSGSLSAGTYTVRVTILGLIKETTITLGEESIVSP